MDLKSRIFFTGTFASGILLLMLCLGSQNLNNRPNIKLGIAITAPLPTGFVTGISLCLGVISGGATSALIFKEEIYINKS
tara:strand:- start:429 stop:668 length:240 start_codon:yes stop_codon:yes gene_type:complete